jgi:hypothetical protein
MLTIRASIPLIVFYNYSKGITILIRYSLARGQFKDAKGVEMPILNYQLQQEKLFPRLGEVYANLFAIKTIMSMAKDVLAEAKGGNFSRLNEAHIVASSVKGLTTKDGLAGL